MLVLMSVAQLCPTLCDPMDCSTPGFPVHHQLLDLALTRWTYRWPSSHLILCHFDVNIAANTEDCLCLLSQRAESFTLDTDPLILIAVSHDLVCYSNIFGKKMINIWQAFLVVSDGFECFGGFFS